LGLAIFVGDVITGSGFRTFLLRLPGPGRHTNNPVFGSNLFWKLGYNPSLIGLDWLSNIFGAKIMVQKPKFW